MVHRAPDSRLLTNLIASEKDYAKHLAALFPLSQSALASLSAYAAASPSHPSSPAQSVAAVVNILASADDALQRYNRAIDTWREQLVSLKDLEDDLNAVLRDRDILVTRLIRASKLTRDVHRSSRLINPLTGLGSASFSSLPSTSSATTGSGSGPASTNSKLAQAQAELQACEAHLAAKERELDARRISVAREGLGARCRALIDCGWVWNEMGKQGLRALQALGPNGVVSSSHMAVSTLGPAIPPHLNAITYASDSSSLTPSQSASQTAARSVETNHEDPVSKEHERIIEPEAKPKTKTVTVQARTTRTEEEGDLTITLPPAHAISELALPTGIRPQPPQNSDLPTQKQATSSANLISTSTPERKRSRRTRRPPSQHISEVSDERSDDPSSASHHRASANVTTSADANPDPVAPHTTLPTTDAASVTHDTSSEEDRSTDQLKVVENNPFEAIRRSMLGPSTSVPFLPVAPAAPTIPPSASVAHGDQSSPSKAVFPSSGTGPGSATGHGQQGQMLGTGASIVRRERRTSVAFFGSLRGLFRKPKERDRVVTEWNEGHSSPSPSSPDRTAAKANGRKGGGWVTRTDARIKASKRGELDSDDEAAPMQAQTQTQARTIVTTASTPRPANVLRQGSGARLRKGRPGASMRGGHENGSLLSEPVAPSHPTGAVPIVDGWATDSPTRIGASLDAGAGADTDAGRGRLRMRRTIKRKKTSVADLRGSDQGHTDGEVDGRGADGHRSLERAHEMSVKPEVGLEEDRTLNRRGSTSKGVSAGTTTDTNTSLSTQPRRIATTTATSSRRLSFDGSPTRRRSASFSLGNTQGTLMLTSTGGNMSWRKPPPQFEPPSRSESPTQSQTPLQAQASSRAQSESQPKQNAKRHLGNGHAVHPQKHAHSQSLMSIVADVARLNENGNVRAATDKSRSLDIPRAPGSVLRGVDRDREHLGTDEMGTGMGANGREHARSSSSPMAVDDGGRGRSGTPAGPGQGQGQGQGVQRPPVKMPLRSALRNASRTPSPSPASVLVPASVTVPIVVPVRIPVRNERGLVPADAAEEDDGRDIAAMSPRDSASISSYETGRESFYVEEGVGVGVPLPPRSQSQPPALRSQSPAPRSHTPPLPPPSFTFPPPPVDPPPTLVPVRGETTHSGPNSNTSEQAPSSNVSTETPPVRRKSVRVSLQPTFSPSPPAMYDDDGDGYVPWSNEGDGEGKSEREGKRGRTARERAEGRKTRRALPGSGSGDVPEDMWADSSSEEETYSRARRLLSMAGRQEVSKKKARAKT